MPETIETRVADALAGFSSRRRYLVGVSGGRDSVCLLHLLESLGFRKLTVCHLDHGLRGPTGREDARFVQRLARAHGFDFAERRECVGDLARTARQSLETAGREARYAFFAEVARGCRCDTLLLAHHADDRVETFLFNLFRGAGPGGLSGMRVRMQRSIGGKRLVIVRPLLGVWRREIDEYVRRHALKYREDATNAGVTHQRNNLRHRILPTVCEMFGRDVRKAIWRTAEILGVEEEWLAGHADTADLAATLSVRDLRALHPAVQRRQIRSWLRGQTVPECGFDEVERVRAMLAVSGPARVNLPAGMFARRRAGFLFIQPPSKQS